MEQTTKRLCPVCEKTLQVEEIIVDGYFDDILNSTPNSVESVMVETNGEWHTTDRKYGSTTRKSKRLPPNAEIIDLTLSDSEDGEPRLCASSSPHGRQGSPPGHHRPPTQPRPGRDASLYTEVQSMSVVEKIALFGMVTFVLYKKYTQQSS